MSSAINHKKRSRFSEHAKGGAFAASSRRAFYNTAYDRNNLNALGALGRMFHRRSPKDANTIKHDEG